MAWDRSGNAASCSFSVNVKGKQYIMSLIQKVNQQINKTVLKYYKENIFCSDSMSYNTQNIKWVLYMSSK